VVTGPFAGMRYLDESVWGPITPKWLGSYEAELHELIEEIIRVQYSRIINVGCAEGYYAVGLARACTSSTIFAFDTDCWSQLQCRQLARLNDVSQRVSVSGYCSHSTLNDSIIPKSTLVICDIEGGEDPLLSLDIVPALLTCDLIVEIHEHECGSHMVEESLANRFSSSHRVTRISALDRKSWIDSQYEMVRTVSRELLIEATAEHRANGLVWLWIKRRED